MLEDLEDYQEAMQRTCDYCGNTGKRPVVDCGLCLACISRWNPHQEEELLRLVYGRNRWSVPSLMQHIVRIKQGDTYEDERAWWGVYVTFELAAHLEGVLAPLMFTADDEEPERSYPILTITLWQPGQSGYLVGWRDPSDPVEKTRDKWEVRWRSDEPYRGEDPAEIAKQWRKRSHTPKGGRPVGSGALRKLGGYSGLQRHIEHYHTAYPYEHSEQALVDYLRRRAGNISRSQMRRYIRNLKPAMRY